MLLLVLIPESEGIGQERNMILKVRSMHGSLVWAEYFFFDELGELD